MKTSAVGVALLTAAVVGDGIGSPADAAKRRPTAKAKRQPTAKTCPSGTTPIVLKRGRKLTLKRDRRGRLRCQPVKRSGLRPPGVTPAQQTGQVADLLATGAGIDPRALAPLERAVGRRRAQSLLALALRAWRAPIGAARGAQIRQGTTGTTTFGTDGAGGSASFGVQQASGDQRGFTATASAELKVTRAELEKSSASSLKENLPADVTGARVNVDVSFQDVNAKCPNAKGAVAGKLRGKGTIKVTVERAGGPPTELTLSAEVAATYEAQLGSDGKVGAVNDLDVQTTFQTGGSGKTTETYRGRRVGTGFGRPGILDADNLSQAFARDAGHIDPNRGGVFGPHGSWRFDKGFPIGDLRTLDNVKAMLSTAVATNLLTLAAVEYLRKVTLERIDKNPCEGAYEVTLAVNGESRQATHDATGRLNVTVVAAPAGSAKPITTWKGGAPSPFEDLVFTTKMSSCPYVSPVTKGSFTVDLELTPAGRLKVTWSSDASSSASVDCRPDGPGDPDPPPQPGQPGPMMINTGPTTFELPAAGGTQPIAGEVSDGGYGFFNRGTLTVKRLD